MFKTLAGLGFVIVLAVAGYFGLQSYIQHRAESLFLQTVESYKEQGLSFRRFNHKGNTLYLYGVNLDKDGFQTIERISLSYDPWVLLQDVQFKKLHFEGISFSYHSDDLKNIVPLPFPQFPVKVIEIENSELSFLTPDWGTYLFEYDVTAEKASQGYELNGVYKSEQPEVRLSGTFQGQLSEEKDSFLNLVLEGLEVEKQNKAIEIKRSNGRAEIQINHDNIFASTVRFELTSGHAVLFGFPWSNANFSFNYDGSDVTFSAGGKAPSDPETEFTYSYQTAGQKTVQDSGVLYSSDGKGFYTYLNRSNLFILNPDDQPHLFTMKNIQIPFEVYPDKRQFLYYLSEDGEKDEKLKREVFY